MSAPQCPKCAEFRQQSKITVSGVTKTVMGTRDHTDDSGRKHTHDPNVTKGNWKCARGHNGTFTEKQICKRPDCSMHTKQPLKFSYSKKNTKNFEVPPPAPAPTEQSVQSLADLVPQASKAYIVIVGNNPSPGMFYMKGNSVMIDCEKLPQ